MSDVPPMPVEAFMGDDVPLSDADWQSLLDRFEREAETQSRVDPCEVAIELAGRESAPFSVCDERTATWALARLAEHDEEIERVNGEYAAYRNQLEAWAHARTKRPASGAEYLRAQLTRWAVKQREANPSGAKSWPLPTGKVATRLGSDRVAIEDQAAVVDWVKSNLPAGLVKDLVQVKESVRVSDLTSYVSVGETVTSAVVELECGHQVTVEGPVQRGEVAYCPDCSARAESAMEAGLMYEVHDVLDEYVSLAVIGKEGRPVGGCRVEPGRISVTITTGGSK